MVNAQRWLEREYSNKSKVTEISTPLLKVLKGELKIENYTELKKINCSYNELTKLAVSGCPKLKVVNCSDNSLTELGLLNCPKVAEVCFSNNQLEKLQLDGIAETAWGQVREQLEGCPKKNKKGKEYYDLRAWKNNREEIQETQSEESSSIHSEITNATSTLTPLLRTYSLGRPILVEGNQKEVMSTFIQSPNVDSLSESSQISTQVENNQLLEELKSQILVLSDKISALEKEAKDLQETNESLRTSLNNYVNSLLDSLIQEQEGFDVNDDKLGIYLENQQKIIDNLDLEEGLGKELNSEQFRNLRKIQKQIFQFQREQMKKKYEAKVQILPRER